MPTTQDPREWLRDLIEDHWQEAIDSLQSDGVSFASVPQPKVYSSRDGGATGDMTNTTRIKVYQAGEEQTSFVSWGDKDSDTTDQYAVHIECDHQGNQAGQRMTAAKRIAKRVLVLHRRDPHPDWHRITNISARNSRDFPDYQRLIITFTLHRDGEIQPDPVGVTR